MEKAYKLLAKQQNISNNAAKESSGPVSFMDIFSQTTQTISQNGRRKLLICY